MLPKIGQSPNFRAAVLKFGQVLRYFATVLFAVPKVRLTKSSQNASYLAKCVSPINDKNDKNDGNDKNN